VTTPLDGCTCASFWTVRQKHKSDCPLAPLDVDELILQYHAEQRNGLNELAGHGTADEQLKQAITQLITEASEEAVDHVLSQDLDWQLDTNSKLTIHFLPEHIRDRLKSTLKETNNE